MERIEAQQRELERENRLLRQELESLEQTSVQQVSRTPADAAVFTIRTFDKHAVEWWP
jgi:hypothetical protein